MGTRENVEAQPGDLEGAKLRVAAAAAGTRETAGRCERGQQRASSR